MSKLSSVMSSAAGPGLISLVLLALLFATEPYMAAAMLGGGAATFINPFALVVAVAAVLGVRTWIGAAMASFAVGVVGRMFGISRLDPLDWGRETTLVIGTMLIMAVILIIPASIRAFTKRARA